MKWNNPGHQLDALGARYLSVKNLYIYGVDEKARDAYAVLQWLGVADAFNISFVLDITVFNQSSEHQFCGRPVIPFQTTLCDRVRSAPDESAVALPWIAQTNERAILEQIGLANLFYLIPSHNRQDNFIQNFVCVWLMYQHGKLLSHWTNFVVTTRCNLNCKYCLNFNESLENPKDVTFEDFKEHIDAIFSKFDSLYSLHFTGGEPLLVRELPRFINYLSENYRDRIFEFFVISNGTILPSEDTMAAVQAINGSFLIDDYSASVPNSKVEAIRQALQARGIGYKVNKADYWFDLDQDNVDYSLFSDEELTCYKDSCNSCLHEFADKKIYACCYQQYANRAGIGTLTTNDYINIATTSKMEILEFRQGYTKNGYVDFCKQCRGIGCNAKRVTPAIQIPKKASIYAQQMLETEQNMKDIVSICVPIYNTEKYLTRCIDSLIAQSYRELEIVLVDDGSTDLSGFICDEYAKKDARVKVVHQANKGEAAARNAGLRAATGTYVMFIDSDDEYLINAVQLLIDGMRADEVDLAIGGYLEKRGEIEHFATGHQRYYLASEIAHAYLTSDCQYAMPYIASTINAKLFRRKLITDNKISYDERFVIGNDSVFMCEYLKYTKKVYDVFAPIYVYYKFRPEERLQGMAWYYPDSFFMFAYVADRMIKLAKLDEVEYKHQIEKQYADFLYALVNAVANEQRYANGIMPYLISFCSEIDFLQDAAKTDIIDNYFKKQDGALPIRLISFLIVKKRYNKLHELLKLLAKQRGVVPYQGDSVRQMIHVTPRPSDSDESVMTTHDFDGLTLKDELLIEQVNDLVTSCFVSQHQADSYQAELAAQKTKIAAYEAELVSDQTKMSEYETELVSYRTKLGEYQAELVSCQTAIDAYKKENDTYRNSKSWRVTKPFRTILGNLRKK